MVRPGCPLPTSFAVGTGTVVDKSLLKRVVGSTFRRSYRLRVVADRLPLTYEKALKSSASILALSSPSNFSTALKTHQYLTNGVLEAYLRGIASDEDKRAAETLLTTDPEIATELDQLEVDMEQYFLQNAVPPPPRVREALLHRIQPNEVQQWQDPTRTFSGGTRPEPPKPNYVDVTVDDTYIRVHKYWRTAFIAVFILSKIFLIAGLYYYFKASNQAEEIERLKTATQQTAPLRNPTP